MSETVTHILDTCSECVLEVHRINCGFSSTHGTSAQLPLQKLYFKHVDKTSNPNPLANRTILKATVILLPLLGLTWVFGILTIDHNTTVFAWLFTICNSTQVWHSNPNPNPITTILLYVGPIKLVL